MEKVEVNGRLLRGNCRQSGVIYVTHQIGGGFHPWQSIKINQNIFSETSINIKILIHNKSDSGVQTLSSIIIT